MLRPNENPHHGHEQERGQNCADVVKVQRRHEMQITNFTWAAPSDDLLWSTIYDWDLQTKLEPTTMVRIVDAPAALRAWRPASGVTGTFILAVQDEVAPWNHGGWRVEFSDRTVRVGRSSESPQISIDVRALSQAYYGTPSVSELRAAGRMDVHDERAYMALCDLLAGPPMWMNDSF